MLQCMKIRAAHINDIEFESMTLSTSELPVLQVITFRVLTYARGATLQFSPDGVDTCCFVKHTNKLTCQLNFGRAVML